MFYNSFIDSLLTYEKKYLQLVLDKQLINYFDDYLFTSDED